MKQEVVLQRQDRFPSVMENKYVAYHHKKMC